MIVEILKTAEELGAKAAERASRILKEAVEAKGTARLMVATGQSHFEFYEALLAKDIPWSQIEIFHLDEYIGIPETHKASFRRYLKGRLLERITPKAAYLIEADRDPAEVIGELTRKLSEAPIDLGIVGIGNNGHIAFNDPPADFEAEELYRVVELDEQCRIQQVNEGWFDDYDGVPATAISATVKQIMSSEAIVSVVPHKAKAWAVRATLNSENVDPMIPASILRTHDNWHLYLDEQSASLLDAGKFAAQ